MNCDLCDNTLIDGNCPIHGDRPVTPDSGLAAVLAREASAEGSPYAESFRRSTPDEEES